ncbi:ATP-dependent DNA ligase [Gordonia rubripertincta]|uniref:DNA ligase (ATP) n=2 Tax=Gordonia rubripertincta TaxID=36822 RepID=A0AAW4GAG0_GORRU|nr:ATP-dependent DNA ligase [Gordonia rubripertincta]MBM7280120.1 ATP-dependent DNA ligase [Gordonia rubripertincta]MDG6780852.1 ATP-dependent DNA ligase [Gordonia rubripertincta]NKY63289.1 ATP-dependent DNA ligase [Gordonia rubripertincta]QMU22154.1 ATP-dependent DNA ligase [Gordonia rubripertincta]GAB87440.1 ATP-dependent DNA ligase LigC [Gordonia rubripertincta NBRC 101908]
MDLPVMPPVAPMLAKAVTAVPQQPDGDTAWSYEPKWDGFRALIFRDGEEVVIGSRGGKDLARYFPEVVAAAKVELPDRVVLDGEIGVPALIGDTHRLDWDSLAQRIHPAESRVNMLAEKTPAIFIGFDALALESTSVKDEPFEVRREALLRAVGPGGRDRRMHVSRVTGDPSVAEDWFSAFEGAGLDGVVAKRLDGLYVENKREMLKIKHKRTADCVIFGYRIHKSGRGIGSMLLGLYGDDGELRMVGGAGAFSDAKRVELQEMFEPMRLDPDKPSPGEPTRWRSEKSGEWIPIRPELVAEFAYDQMENQRFRHTVKFLRWRPDRDPESCGYDQLEVPLTYDLHDVLEGE